jgi:hypothetical protein
MADLMAARRCFRENLATYTPPSASSEYAEKFNLYQGLDTLAEALMEVQSRLASIEAALQRRG